MAKLGELMSVWRVWSYLATVALTVIAVAVVRWLATRWRAGRFTREFWKRQSHAALHDLGVLSGALMPRPLKVFEDQFALETALQVISMAREHGVLAFVGANPGVTAAKLAAAFGFSARQVQAGIEVLRASEVLVDADGGYALSPAAQVYLMRDSPLLGGVLPPPTVGKKVIKLLRSGWTPGSVRRWATGRSHTPLTWAAGMHRISFPLGFALAASGLLRGAQRILDVAGGAGSVCVALALTDASRRVKLIELPGSTAIAERLATCYGVADRVSCLGLDMFRDPWPTGWDAVLFTNIFHDWNDEKCAALARRAYDGLTPGGRIVVQEALLDDDAPGPLWTAHFSMSMALHMEGRQFRARELARLLESAGFQCVEVHPLLGHYSAITAVRTA